MLLAKVHRKEEALMRDRAKQEGAEIHRNREAQRFIKCRRAWRAAEPQGAGDRYFDPSGTP
jgi:hypothetical protein